MLTDSLDRFYCLAKLRYICEIYARGSMLYDTLENRLEDEVRKVSEKWKGDDFPLFECYRRLYDLMTAQSFDIQNFKDAKDYILANHKNISRSELYVIISTLINAMAMKGYQGRDFQKLKHEVYDFGFKHQTLSDDYFINPQLMVYAESVSLTDIWQRAVRRITKKAWIYYTNVLLQKGISSFLTEPCDLNYFTNIIKSQMNM